MDYIFKELQNHMGSIMAAQLDQLDSFFVDSKPTI
jgi:hypothetical protein